MSRKTTEIIALVVFALLFLILVLKTNDQKKQLLKDGVFVLGKLNSSSFGGDQGWVYSYKYWLNGKEYLRKFTGPIKKEILEDSLLFFKVSVSKPEICREYSDTKVPSCLELNEVPAKGWKSLPLKVCE